MGSLFCFKSEKHKPKKSKNTEIHNSNNSNYETQHATSNSIALRFVKTEFRAKVEDELSVMPGDVVLLNSIDKCIDGEWANVTCLKRQLIGYVPAEVLTTERPLPQIKKKLPRSDGMEVEHHHHPLSHAHQHHHHHHHHPHNTHDISSGQPSLNEESIRLHTHVPRLGHQQPRFDMSGSLQGSSGRQSFQRYLNTHRQFSPPAYYNVRPNMAADIPGNSPVCREFRRENYGLFLVTYNFVAREENDLDVKPGEYVTVLNKEDDDWYWVRREYDSFEGFVPSKFICDNEQVKSIQNKGSTLNKGSTVTMKSSQGNHDYHTYINHPENSQTDRQSLAMFNHI